MPQHQPFTYIPPTHVTPITCPHCGGMAPLIERTPRSELKGETRTFECRDCGKTTEMTL